ncbi:MAG: hypothetical protein KAX20_03005 [Candidatus Omnitrophica bacterium]|nr:hypothetical protein [Candidatus Omnitrophota bacterium]
MKKILLIGLAGILLLSNFCFAKGFQNEPDGFRGIKWGTDISTLKDMEYFWTDPSYGGIKIYIRKSEDLHIGEAKLKRIGYGFWRGKFCDVWVITKSSVNWVGLRDAVFEKFGRGYQDNEFIEYYVWGGKITLMSLEYNEVSKEGKLHILSKEIYKQQKAYQKQKAKEGAETGF